MQLYIKCLAIMLLLISCGNSYALPAGNIDSLKAILPSQKDDTIKANILLSLSRLSYESSHQQAYQWADEAYTLSQKLGYAKGRIGALFIKGFIYVAFKQQLDIGYKYYLESYKLAEAAGDKYYMGKCLLGMGYVYMMQKQYGKSIDNYEQAKDIFLAIRDSGQVASCYSALSEVQQEKGNFAEAIRLDNLGLRVAERIHDKRAIARLTSTLSAAMQKSGRVQEAIGYAQQAVALNKELGVVRDYAYNLTLLAEQYGLINEYGKAFQIADSALVICRSNHLITEEMNCYDILEKLYARTGDYKQAYDYKNRFIAIRDSSFSQDRVIEIANLESKYNQEKADVIKHQELVHQKLMRNVFIAGFSVLLIFLLLLSRQRNKIREAKAKSDQLLLNILPAEVAEELKVSNSSVARHFDNVSVLFTDFVNFTGAAERMSPKGLVDELHTCFKAFDEITGKYGVEKIKTIGDAYMAVAGLPVDDPQHAEHIVKAAIEIRAYMQRRRAELGEGTFIVRIGIHSGSVVAGIVGAKKFQYDIWGDTVNIAARMEQHSEAAKINISQSTYELVKDKFTCTYRGELQAKNKGMLKMYFVEA